MKKIILAVALALLVLATLAACAAQGTANPSVAATSPPLPTGTQEPSVTPQPSQTATPAPTATATPDTRLDPNDWKHWPVIPTLSARALEIYNAGLAMGNNPHAFSKIGDCQVIKEVFMGIYDMPGRYFLSASEQYLQQTIDNFAGYFNTDGQAVKGGFNAATVLSAMWANPDYCLPGETPLECEVRIARPTFAIIRLERWFEGRTAERYEMYMRQIIEYLIAHGVVPILATKADNVEGDNSLNLTTARLAYEYDIPLWNWWLEAQPLPNHGMDPDRPDGFHISPQAWDEASYGALRTLDALWRAATGQ
jgi:hypothetical protein